MTEEQKEMLEALTSAFDVCFTTKDVLGNVIAGSEVVEKADIELYEKADVFLKWYTKKFAKKKPIKRKTGGCH